jgi:hypothetical protein
MHSVQQENSPTNKMIVDALRWPSHRGGLVQLGVKLCPVLRKECSKTIDLPPNSNHVLVSRQPNLIDLRSANRCFIFPSLFNGRGSSHVLGRLDLSKSPDLLQKLPICIHPKGKSPDPVLRCRELRGRKPDHVRVVVEYWQSLADCLPLLASHPISPVLCALPG